MDTAPPLSAAPTETKYFVELADERQGLRKTHDVTWKSARWGEKDLGIWSPYPGPAGGDDGHIVRVRDAFYLSSPGAVIDAKGRLLKGSLAGGDARSARIDQMPLLRPKRDGWMFSAPAQLPRLGPAALFCQWPGAHNYAHFLLESMVGLAMLDDGGALSRFAPTAPVLDQWRRDLVALYLDDKSLPLREVEAPVVRLDDALFGVSSEGPLRPPMAALALVRERLLARAIAVSPRAKPVRRIYFLRSNGRHSSADKALFADLRELGFLVVDPLRLTPVEQIVLVSRAHVIIGEAAAPLANALFAPAGARVIELQRKVTAEGWVSRLCDAVGLRWFGLPCLPAKGDAPLAISLASTELDVSIEALRALLEETA